MEPVLLAALNCDPEGRFSATRGSRCARDVRARRQGLPTTFCAEWTRPGARRSGHFVYYRKRRRDTLRPFPARGRMGRMSAPGHCNLLTARSNSAAEDQVVIAAPAWVARNAHPRVARANGVTDRSSTPTSRFPRRNPFRRSQASLTRRLNGCLRSTTRLSVTVSSADRFNEADREPLARQIWSEVSVIAASTPSFRAGRSSRSGVRHLLQPPDQNALRPPRRDSLEKSLSGRRLDRYRPPRHDRRRDIGPEKPPPNWLWPLNSGTTLGPLESRHEFRICNAIRSFGVRAHNP